MHNHFFFPTDRVYRNLNSFQKWKTVIHSAVSVIPSEMFDDRYLCDFKQGNPPPPTHHAQYRSVHREVRFLPNREDVDGVSCDNLTWAMMHNSKDQRSLLFPPSAFISSVSSASFLVRAPTPLCQSICHDPPPSICIV